MQTFIKNISKISAIGLFLASQGCTSPTEITVTEKFMVTDSLIDRLLIDTVLQADNRTDLSFSAKITADEARMAEVFPMVSGMVSNVQVSLGDKVNKGQALATISSAEMAQFEKEAISATAELRNAERNLKQADELFKSGLSSAKELEEAKNDFLIKKAESNRAKAVLALSDSKGNGNYVIKSPLSGFIIQKNITANMQLRPDNDNSVFTIADLSTVWAIINIYESDISRIKEGDEVTITLLSYPEKQFTGKIDRVYNMIDNESKVMNARVSILNSQYMLKPGMMATVKVSAKSGINLPVVNARGIIFDENKNYVLVLDDHKKVRIQEIEIGRKTTGKAYVSQGLNAGDRIIASKQVFLYESLKN